MKRKNKSYGIRKSNTLHQHWTWKGGTMKPKLGFKTIDDALDYIKERNIKGYHPYICPDCNMWHLGHDKR